MQFRHWLLLSLLGGLLPLSAARACNVPVFRYAIERWRPDFYEAVIFQRGPLSAEQQALVKEMQKLEDANLRATLVDLDGEVEPADRKLWDAQKDPSLPWLVVRYPDQAGVRAAVWKGPLDKDVVMGLIDSPARRAIASRLMKKDSTVWLLLESGDKDKDDAVAKLLQTELAALEKSLKLPVDPAEPETDPKAAKENQLLSPTPLKISFSLVQVARNDPAEKLLVAMLLEAIEDPKSAKATEPVLFPIFGRGRALEAVVGKEIDADAIGNMAAFLCGACSCTVKALNPGVDLLFKADWDSILGENTPVVAEPPVQPGKLVAIPQPSVKLKATPPVAQTPPVEGPVRDLRSGVIGGVVIFAVLAGLLFVGGFRKRAAPSDRSPDAM